MDPRHDCAGHRTAFLVSIVIEVPQAGKIAHQPRRAEPMPLDFCNGSIIGVCGRRKISPEATRTDPCSYKHFERAPQNVACVKGLLGLLQRPDQLDFAAVSRWNYAFFVARYSPGCRTSRADHSVRRHDAFLPTFLSWKKLCGWDAHNVTEGTQTSGFAACAAWVPNRPVATVTYEEAKLSRMALDARTVALFCERLL